MVQSKGTMQLFTREDVDSEQEAIMQGVVSQKELCFPPGSDYLYCNTNYILLAEIVQRVSMQSFAQFASENIFKPLGMTSTQIFDDHTKIIKNKTHGYLYSEEENLYRACFPILEIVGDGGVITCVDDFHRWSCNFYHNILGSGSSKLIETLQLPGT